MENFCIENPCPSMSGAATVVLGFPLSHLASSERFMTIWVRGGKICEYVLHDRMMLAPIHKHKQIIAGPCCV